MRALIALVAVLTTTLAVPAPARAATYVDVTANDVRTPRDGCASTTITVDGDWAGDTNQIQISVYGPGGRETWFDYAQDDGPVGSVDFTYPACAGEPAGRYRVEATALEYDEQDNVLDTTRAYGSFRVRHPEANLRKNARLTLRTRSIRRGPYRTAAVADLNVLKAPARFDRGKKVNLYAYLLGDWYVIDSARTNRHGKVGWIFKPNDTLWSMCSPPTRTVKAACTRNFRTRGGGGLQRPPSNREAALVPGPGDSNTSEAEQTELAELVTRR